jgi:hypothetical protein
LFYNEDEYEYEYEQKRKDEGELETKKEGNMEEEQEEELASAHKHEGASMGPGMESAYTGDMSLYSDTKATDAPQGQRTEESLPHIPLASAPAPAPAAAAADTIDSQGKGQERALMHIRSLPPWPRRNDKHGGW